MGREESTKLFVLSMPWFLIFKVNFLFYSSAQFFQFDSSKKGKEKKIIALAEKTVEFYRC